MRILLHLHRTARPSRAAAHPTGTAHLRCMLTVCAPPEPGKIFRTSGGAVEPGATAYAQVRTYFIRAWPIFMVSAWAISVPRVGQRLVGMRPGLLFQPRLMVFDRVRAQKHD